MLDGNLTIIFELLQELYELSDVNSYFLRGLDCKSRRFADNLLCMTQNLMLSAKNLASHHSSFEWEWSVGEAGEICEGAGSISGVAGSANLVVTALSLAFHHNIRELVGATYPLTRYSFQYFPALYCFRDTFDAYWPAIFLSS